MMAKILGIGSLGRMRGRIPLAVIAVLVGVVSPFAASIQKPAAADHGPGLAIDSNPDRTVFETTIVAMEATVDIGDGVMANAYTYGGTVPGPEIRVKVGDEVIVHFENQLPEGSSIHFHGIELNNVSDGTGVTQNAVPNGGFFTYRFIAPRPGVFWYHPHMHPVNAVFKGQYGAMIVEDPAEDTLQAAGVLPTDSETHTLVLADTNVCKAPGQNPDHLYGDDPNLPWAGGPIWTDGSSKTLKAMCEETPVDNHGVEIPDPFMHAAGDIPNHYLETGVRDGTIVLTNGQEVAGRSGSPQVPGAIDAGADLISVPAGRALRLQVVNAATNRYFRLLLTDDSGNQIPLLRIGGQGGLLDAVRTEGGTEGTFDTKYDDGEILLSAADRADIVVVIPPTATGTATLWTLDYERFSNGWAAVPTVPVAHIDITAAVPAGQTFTMSEGDPLLTHASVGRTVENLRPLPTDSLVDPATLPTGTPGSDDHLIRLTGGGTASIDNVQGIFDVSSTDYKSIPHIASSRFTRIGDLLELTIQNDTGTNHPFHLHGFSFQPIRMVDQAGPTTLWNIGHNEFVDNYDIPGNRSLVIRVRIHDRPNPDGSAGGAVGRWVFHCHIFFHATRGMIAELVVLPPEAAEPGGTDFNGDGYDELVIADPRDNGGEGTVQIIDGSPNGIHDRSRRKILNIGASAASSGAFGTATTSGDYNGDGYEDLVVSGRLDGTAQGQIELYLGGPFGIGQVPKLVIDQDFSNIPDTAESGDRFGASLTTGDFNGDRYHDLAIGIPGEDGHGAVQVLYGERLTGLHTLLITTYLDQDVAGVIGAGESGDAFGEALAAADFDADGYDELAVGVPGEAIFTIGDEGAIHLFSGGPITLVAAADALFNQGTTGTEGSPEAGDRFGSVLATGNLDGDNYPDLVVGIPNEAVGAITNAGAVQVFFGHGAGPSPLDFVGDLLNNQGALGFDGAAEINDLFGASVALADVTGDGFDDLVAGVPGENGQGAVQVVPGSSSGYNTPADYVFSQDSGLVAEAAETADEFGGFLAIGDYNHDGVPDVHVGALVEQLPAGVADGEGVSHVLRGDASTALDDMHSGALIIHHPIEDPGADFNGDGFSDLVIHDGSDEISALANAGSVQVIYGTFAGIDESATRQVLTAGTPAADDFFGDAAVAADFNSDGFDDLAIGAWGANNQAGEVAVHYGGPAGLEATASLVFDQDSAGAGDTAEAFDHFGMALAAGDVNGDHYSELMVGIPGEDYLSFVDAGALQVFAGSAAGLQTSAILITQNLLSGDSAESGDRFGWALASGDFNRDQTADIAVGVPDEQVFTAGPEGAVTVLSGSQAGVQFLSSFTFNQGSVGVEGTPEVGDGFGSSLAVGDIDFDGADDLAVGAPLETLAGANQVGAVGVFFGSPTPGSPSLDLVDDRVLYRTFPGVSGLAAPGLNFGHSIQIGNFEGALGNDDLVISTRGVADAGEVQMFRGLSPDCPLGVCVPGGIDLRQDLIFDQSLPLGIDLPEPGDRFSGLRNTVGDFDGNGMADLHIFVADEAVPGTLDSGVSHILSGSSLRPLASDPSPEFVVHHPLEHDLLTALGSPCVVFDSIAAATGPVTPGTPKTVQLSGALTGQGGASDCAVPATATAAVVSLVSDSPTGAGNLRISAAGVLPSGGVVNYTSNTLRNSNTVTVDLSATGAVDVAANNNPSEVHMAVIAYYSPGGTLRYSPLTPCAVADSRSGQGSSGSFVGPFAAGSAYPDVDLVGSFNTVGDNQGGGNTDCGVPAGADAVMVNVVAIASSGGTGGLALGIGGSEPTEATTNFGVAGLNNAASMIVPLGAGETVATNIAASSGTPSTQIRIVVLGYFATSGDDYVGINPCAVFDTRSSQSPVGGFLGKRPSGTATTYQVSGSSTTGQGGAAGGCDVPSGASSVLINLVAIQPVTFGNLRAYATGTTPTGGVVNFAPLSPPMNNSNAVVVPLSTGGQLDLFVNTSTNDGTPTVDVRGIVLGYYS